MASAPPPTAGAEPSSTKMKLRIGLPSGQVETLHLQPSSPLSSLVSRIRAHASLDPEKTRVRLITSGRLLSDQTASVGTVLSDNDFVHCAVSEVLPPAPESPPERRGESRPALVITAGAPGAPGSEVRIVLHDLGPAATARLSEAGFSASEAASLTAQLRRVRAEVSELRGSRSSSEQRRARSAERAEREDGTAITTTSSVEGTNTDFLMGCVCGYLLGVLVLALLLDKNITRRWRVGIVAGVATNCAFGILRTTVISQSFIAPP